MGQLTINNILVVLRMRVAISEKVHPMAETSESMTAVVPMAVLALSCTLMRKGM
jgi:hypothetical protein